MKKKARIFSIVALSVCFFAAATTFAFNRGFKGTVLAEGDTISPNSGFTCIATTAATNNTGSFLAGTYSGLPKDKIYINSFSRGNGTVVNFVSPISVDDYDYLSF